MANYISKVKWQHYREDGYARIGRVATDEELSALQSRIDDIMLGKAPLDYDRLMMQLDREPGTEGPGPQTAGHKGATLSYRKIQSLEFDPLFLSYMQKPVFREACAKVYGEETPIACYRAMFMNKPAREGTYLNWHQDRWTHLDQDPLLTIYTALDPATIENGCVRIIPNSHHSLVYPVSRRRILCPSREDCSGVRVDFAGVGSGRCRAAAQLVVSQLRGEFYRCAASGV